MTTGVLIGASLLGAFTAAFWALIAAHLAAFRRRHHRLSPDDGDAGAVRGVRVSIVVPVHDGAATLGACLRSLLAQSHRDFELIVVDDRSTDASAALAEQIAGADPRLRVVRVAALPSGWTGKTHALHLGTAGAGGEWLFYTDADTVHHPGALAACLRRAVSQRLDLLSGWPALHWERPLAAILNPVCGAVFASWYRTRRRQPPPFANGQALLIRADAYRAVGGHAAVRDRLLEDVALAERCAAQGRRLDVVMLQQVLRVRAYDGLTAHRHAWVRLFLAGGHGSVRRLRRRALALPVLGLGGYAAMAAGAAGVCSAAAGAGVPLATGALAVAVMTAAVAIVNRDVGVPARYALLAPLATVFAAACLAGAARRARSGGSVEWHGVSYAGTS